MGYHEQVGVSNIRAKARAVRLKREGRTDWGKLWFSAFASAYGFVFWLTAGAGILRFAWPYIRDMIGYG